MEGTNFFKNIKKLIIGGAMVTTLLMGVNQAFAADHSSHYIETYLILKIGHMITMVKLT